MTDNKPSGIFVTDKENNAKSFISELGNPYDIILTDPSGLISIELGVGFRATSGPIINKAGDLAALLTNLKPKDVLFIDEIHRR